MLICFFKSSLILNDGKDVKKEEKARSRKKWREKESK